jgi:hypothetical protein
MFLDHFGHIYRAKILVKSKTPNASKDLKDKFLAPKIVGNFEIFSFIGKIIMVDFFHFCPKILGVLEKS